MTDDKLIALGRELDAYAAAEAHYGLNGLLTGEAEAAEEARLGAWYETILNRIMDARPTTSKGWSVKLRAIEYCNSAGELTPADRVEQAESRSDALAWTLIRDMLEAQAAGENVRPQPWRVHHVHEDMDTPTDLH